MAEQSAEPDFKADIIGMKEISCGYTLDCVAKI